MLRALGAQSPGTALATLDGLARPEVVGGGRKVGEIRAVLPFEDS